ncbi:MAG: Yip1 family protein [Promethearchaeota archaeon]
MLGIAYEILLFLDPSGSISYHDPIETGADLIEDNLVIESALGIIYLTSQVTVIILVIGLFIKGLQSKGIIRKKMSYVSLGAFILIICAFIDSIILPSIFLILNRTIWLFGITIIYKGIKEEFEKPKELKSKAELKVEGDLFRLIKNRPSEITEEEITYLKELKKCLVCKGDATGFNIYVCPNCDVLYCQRCARIIVEKDNACWSCNGPIDKSKPTRLEKEEFRKVESKFIKDTDPK